VWECFACSTNGTADGASDARAGTDGGLADAEQTTPCTVVSVNDDATGPGAQRFAYSGSWSIGEGADKFGGDDHYSSTTGNSYTVSFSGESIALFGATAPWHGIAAVSIDDGAAQDVDFYSANRADQVELYTSPLLSAGEHTLTVRVTGRQHAASTGTTITADRVDICASTPGTDGGVPDGGALDAGGGEVRDTMYVEGRWLRDRCGEQVVLRGANAGIAFPSDPQAEDLAQLAQTGANAVRLTFRMIYNNSSPSDVDIALTKAREAGLIAIPSVWDATGDWGKLGDCVDFWLDPEMVEVLKEHEEYTILNIANEAGTSAVTNDQYRTEYAAAIQRIRAAGLKMPLMIDAANWGRNESYILENGAYLVQQDPEHSLVFSWHPWDPNQPATRYQNAFASSIGNDLCLVVGEFAHLDVFYDSPIPYLTIMEEAQLSSIGWLWWWWYGNDLHSLTTDGQYGNWANAGEEVCLSSPYGIQQTSTRTHYFQTGSCQ